MNGDGYQQMQLVEQQVGREPFWPQSGTMTSEMSQPVIFRTFSRNS